MKPTLIISLFFLLLTGCGEEETQVEQACLLSSGEYSIVSMTTSTDCPEVFGQPSQTLQDNGTVWEIPDLGYECGKTYKDFWDQMFFTGPCKCAIVYEDFYYEITATSFSLNRQTEFQCLPAFDPKDVGCKKECVAEGVVHGRKQ